MVEVVRPGVPSVQQREELVAEVVADDGSLFRHQLWGRQSPSRSVQVEQVETVGPPGVGRMVKTVFSASSVRSSSAAVVAAVAVPAVLRPRPSDPVEVVVAPARTEPRVGLPRLRVVILGP